MRRWSPTTRVMPQGAGEDITVELPRRRNSALQCSRALAGRAPCTQPGAAQRSQAQPSGLWCGLLNRKLVISERWLPGAAGREGGAWRERGAAACISGARAARARGNACHCK